MLSHVLYGHIGCPYTSLHGTADNNIRSVKYARACMLYVGYGLCTKPCVEQRTTIYLSVEYARAYPIWALYKALHGAADNNIPECKVCSCMCYGLCTKPCVEQRTTISLSVECTDRGFITRDGGRWLASDWWGITLKTHAMLQLTAGGRGKMQPNQDSICKI